MMLRNEPEQTLAVMRQDLTLIATRAKSVSFQLHNLTRKIESSKVELLQKLLEDRIRSEARRRGAASVMKDKSQLRTGILFAAGSFIVGGLLAGDKWAALNSGLAGLDGALQGFGHSRWVVLLGESIAVKASESTPLEAKWITWESLKLAVEELRKKAQLGEALGNLDDVLSRLEQKRERRFIPVMVVTGQPKPRGDPIR